MSFAVLDGALQIFNVDHGQCTLLTVPSSYATCHRILIDCGHAVDYKGAPWYPGHHLSEMGVKYIDLLICTNYDEDHASGFPDLYGRDIAIGCILGNPTVSPDAITRLKSEDGMGNGIKALADVLRARKAIGWTQAPPMMPGVDLTWFWNPYPYFDDENNLSLVAVLDIHGYRFLFPGDMKCDGFENLLNTCAPFRIAVSGVDVLVASHHGRHNGICPAMFTTYGCKPALIVISDDYKQYDTQETTSYYYSKARGISSFRGGGPRYVLTTRDDDEIKFSFQNGKCWAW